MMLVRKLFFFLGAATLLCVSHAQDAETGRSKLPKPDFAEVAYGAHERQVMDVWLAKSDQPTPVLIYFHGGGFVTGSKANLPARLLREALKAGISVVAANYRFSPEVSFPQHYLDCARALQFTRAHAAQWNLDSQRVALTGSSAGAGTALWIAFHDDLADATSADPIARESTRVSSVVVSGAQPSYDPRLIRELAGEAAARHHVFSSFYGLRDDELDSPRAHALFAEAAAISYLTSDDPAVFAYYSEPRGAVAPDAKAGTGIHHPNLGLYLQREMNAVGVECVFRHKDEGGDVVAAQIAFLKKHFSKTSHP
jgi:acetyl esterase